MVRQSSGSIEQSLPALVVFLCLAGTLLAVSAAAQPPLPKVPGKPPIAERPFPSPPEALERLMRGIASKSSEERFRAAEQFQEVAPQFTALATMALTKALSDPDDHVRLAALNALGGIGPSAEQALPAVEQRLKSADDEYERVLAAWVATQLSSDRQTLRDSIPALVASLSSENKAVADQAADALVAFGVLAEPALIASLAEPAERGTVLSLGILGQAGAQKAVPDIAKLMNSGDAEVRAAAIAALGAIGPASAPVVPLILKRLADDATPSVRARAAAALGLIGTQSPEVTKALTDATGASEAAVAREAIRSLVHLQADTGTITPLATRFLADARRDVAVEAMAALADQGPAALPVVKAALANEDSQYAAVLVISDLGSTAKETVPELIALIGGAPTPTKREALMALGSMGKDAASAVPTIARELADDDAAIRYAALFALGRIGVKSDGLEEVLTQNLKSPDAFLKLLSAWALAKLNPADASAASRAIELLAEGLTSDTPTVQQGAALCLVELKPSPDQLPQLIPKFLAALGTPDESVRRSVLEALLAAVASSGHAGLLNDLFAKEPLRPVAAMIARHSGAQAKGSLGSMTDALGDPRSQVRRDVALAMAGIGPDALSAAPALVRLLNDTDPEVRRAAILALGGIGPGAKEAIAPLRAIVAGSGETAKPLAAWALAIIASDDPATATSVLPVLVARLASERAEDREQAAEALGRLGRLGSPALTDLQIAASDRSEAVRRAATHAMQTIQAEK